MHDRRAVVITGILVTLCALFLGVHPAVAAAGSESPGDVPQATWVTSLLDSVGDVGYFTSIAVDASDKVHISYIDDGGDMLKYASNASGQWVITSVRQALGLNNTSIGVDSTGKVYIAYRNSSTPVIAIRDQYGNWTTQSPGFNYPISGGISLAVDKNDIVHVAAPTIQKIQYQPDTYRMEYANNSSGPFKNLKYLPTCMTGAITLRSASVATDANNNIYVNFNVSDTLVYATNKSGAWACSYLLGVSTQPIYYSNRYSAVKSTGQLVTAAISGSEFMALALDGADKSHIVGHYNNCLRYSTDRTGSLQSTDVDCTSAKVGEYGSVAVDRQGGIHLAYFDRTNGDLMYATQSSAAQAKKSYLPLILGQANPAP
jgi:hypothetical protein